MTLHSNDLEDEIAKILDARAGRAALDSIETDLAERPEVRGLLAAADLAWASAQSAPSLTDDPVAAMLGLVPDPELQLDGRELSRARKRAGLTVSVLAQRLVARGWDTTSKAIFAWESGQNSPHVPALINAIAEETGADADRLRRRSGVDQERVALGAIAESETYKGLIQRWARVQGTTLALAASALESRMLVAVHRGGAPETDVLLEALEAMISAVEGSERP